MPQQLLSVLFAINSYDVLGRFLRDILTEKEIREISARLEAARLLKQNATYATIAAQTKLSSRTIARISDWIQNGSGGYEAVLDHHAHIPPARAE